MRTSLLNETLELYTYKHWWTPLISLLQLINVLLVGMSFKCNKYQAFETDNCFILDCLVMTIDSFELLSFSISKHPFESVTEYPACLAVINLVVLTFS